MISRIGRYIAAVGLGLLVSCTNPYAKVSNEIPGRPPTSEETPDKPLTSQQMKQLHIPILEEKSHYDIGKQNLFERLYNVDLIGEYNGETIRTLRSAMDKIESKLPYAFDRLDLVLAHSEADVIAHAKSNSTEVIDGVEVEGDFLLSRDFGEIVMQDRDEYLKSPRAVFIHETMHLLFGQVDDPPIYGKLSETNARIVPIIRENPEGALVGKRMKGFVSWYSNVYLYFDLKRATNPEAFPNPVFFLIDERGEEAAELGTYWIEGETYADDDNVVREKLEIIKKFLEERYAKSEEH